MNDTMRQDAIAIRLQEIGENFVHIRDNTPDFYEKYSDDSWSKVIGLRNIISHGYSFINQEKIWDIIVNYLPELTDRIDSILDEGEVKL
jgi:uncharacterized protein with HEPN domain